MKMTEGGTMTIQEHYQASVFTPRLLAGQECCKWHKRMKTRNEVKIDVFTDHPRFKRVELGGTTP